MRIINNGHVTELDNLGVAVELPMHKYSLQFEDIGNSRIQVTS